MMQKINGWNVFYCLLGTTMIVLPVMNPPAGFAGWVLYLSIAIKSFAVGLIKDKIIQDAAAWFGIFGIILGVIMLL